MVACARRRAGPGVAADGVGHAAGGGSASADKVGARAAGVSAPAGRGGGALLRTVALLAGLLLTAGCRLDGGPADVVLRGGPVHTLDSDRPLARAVALRDGRIQWLGSSEAAGRWIGPATEIVELRGRALLPGFADAHLHLFSLADSLAEVDLVGSTSYAEVVARVAAAATRCAPGTWITGRGWDQNDWDETRLPQHALLSAAVDSHPVALERIDGHALLLNARALAAAGVDRHTAEPHGGRIHRDDSGEPSGVLVDDAMELVLSAIPRPSREEQRRRLGVAIAHLHERGVTAIHEAGLSREELVLLEELARAGELPLRVHALVDADEPALRWPAARSGWPSADLTGDGVLAVRGIKAVADGALGSRGAELSEPYADEPGQRGLVLASTDELAALASFALDRGFQLATHAIGDAANRRVLDAYERAFATHPSEVTAAARFRVEHVQVLHPDDLPRFAALGVLPSMQAQHCTSDMPWVPARLGPERSAWCYAWRALLDSGVIVPGGSDAPVESVDLPALLAAAVTRTDAAGRPVGGFHAEQRMTRQEALAHVTLWPAIAAFREADLGSITVGKRADLVLLSGDPLTVPEAELAQLGIELTIFGGRVVHRRGASP